ncbi:MAG: DUF6455 family protein [Roseovarius sp.]
MPRTRTMRQHTELVDMMARTLGIDLEEEVYSGQLDPEALCDAVLRCTGCSNPDGCEAWMAAQGTVADAAPAMCRNGEVFATLKAGRRV